MAENASIAIYDGESTPVERTYNPTGIENGVASYQDYSTETFPPGQGTLSISMSKKGVVRRVPITSRLNRVVTKTVDGVDFEVVADYCIVKTEVLVPETWPVALTHNAVALHKNLLDTDVVQGYTERGEKVW
jgi:hypothetical protein